MKKTVYTLAPACAVTLQADSAETIPSNPTLLTADEMDQVTAGLSVSVDAVTGAFSDFLSLSSTNTAAFPAQIRICPLMPLPL
jgi:hypothetical protein